MTTDRGELSDIEQDALAEIVNLGVSRAAASLRQSVPANGLMLLAAPLAKFRPAAKA